MSLYDFIIERLPDVDGYGNTNKIIDDDGVSNHSAFKQFVREDHEGDVGVYIISDTVDTKYHTDSFKKADIQVVVNTVNGDIDGALAYLTNTLINIKNNEKSNDIWVKSLKLLNVHPVGMNSAGIHWCVMNLHLKYIVAQN